MADTDDYKPPFGFDIRVKPNAEDFSAREEPLCEWKGCKRPGECRAPVSPDRPGEFWLLCKEHARQHNQSWDFFKGMSEDEMQAYRESIATGHRPTWRMGVNGDTQSRAADHVRATFKPGSDNPRMRVFASAGIDDPYRMFRENADGQRTGEKPAKPARHLTRLQKAALDDLGLGENAVMNDVRARYKELVKRFHPDANGGDRGAEDSLQRVIRAYQTLKTSGFR